MSASFQIDCVAMKRGKVSLRSDQDGDATGVGKSARAWDFRNIFKCGALGRRFAAVRRKIRRRGGEGWTNRAQRGLPVL
jgi:hypothetical protein